MTPKAGSVDDTHLIGIDWGTSSLRAYRLDRAGNIVETRTSGKGILTVKDASFEQTLTDVAGDWLSAGPCPVVLSGMITSRQGWIEQPYVSCPAGRHDLSSAIHSHRLSNQREIHFVTGLKITGADGVPDVMRGEETQIIGALGNDEGARLFVLPGTHSKWALTENGKITNFATFITGELFSVLSKYSILGRLMDGDRPDKAAFIQGVAYGQNSDQSAGGLLKRLFGSRALGLFGRIPGTGAASHLSGLLIGSEVREALACIGVAATSGPVTVLGESNLVDLYAIAFDHFGIESSAGPKAAAARGQFAIARAAGLL